MDPSAPPTLSQSAKLSGHGASPSPSSPSSFVVENSFK
jgi:hypothetical protein